jgi:hypothetical protein
MKSAEKKRKSVQWFEPRWSFAPRLKMELIGFLQLKMWARIFVVVILLTALVAHWLKSKLPDLEFDWAEAVASSFGIFIFIMAIIIGISFAVPPLIQINSKGISYQQGQSVQRRIRSDIRNLIIDVTDLTRPVLRVESVKKPLVIGISSKVSLRELAAFLQTTFPELIVTEKR